MIATNEQYVAKGGMCCPFCQACEVSAGRLKVDGPTITQVVECAVCQRDWVDVYTLTGYQVEGESQAPDAAPASPGETAWHPCSIHFERVESDGATTRAYLSLLTRTPMVDEDAMASLNDAVTTWVIETTAGREMWAASVEDLNIGDLFCYDCFSDAGLLSRMEARGLRFVSGDVAGTEDRPTAYDTVLVDSDRLLDSTEAATAAAA